LRGWAVLGIYAVLLALCVAALRPRLMSWGATEAEQRIALPGDTTAGGPAESFTRAISINAPAEQIWPWLVQMQILALRMALETTEVAEQAPVGEAT
jgi:hypothetical protein